MQLIIHETLEPLTGIQSITLNTDARNGSQLNISTVDYHMEEVNSPYPPVSTSRSSDRMSVMDYFANLTNEQREDFLQELNELHRSLENATPLTA